MDIQENTKKCFVITPIGQEDSEIRRNMDAIIETIIRPVVKDFGMEAYASHQIPEPGSIDASVMRAIFDSDLVIANLTHLNPNVMYELAVRHAANKPVVCIVEKGTVLPFDLGHQRALFYRNDISGVEVFKKSLHEYIDFALKNDCNNPITSAINDLDLINRSKKLESSGSEFERCVLDMLGKLTLQQEKTHTYIKTRNDGSKTYYICTELEARQHGLFSRGYKLHVYDNRHLDGGVFDGR